MKYNVKEIMVRAWEIKHENDCNIFSFCLKMAWMEAKNKMDKKIFEGRALMETSSGSKAFKLWEKYGKRRIYITRDDGKKTYGYIDLNNGNAVVCGNDLRWAIVPAAEKFLAEYEVA